jgi:ADP-ribose pyrophosphatase YjhB (NUDIX family)
MCKAVLIRDYFYMTNNWLEIAKQMQAIAQSGLTYAKDQFDIERYKQLEALSLEAMKQVTGDDVELIRDLFANESGYKTPKVGVRAIIFRDDKVLMVKEKIDGGWCIPGGWCDIHLSPKENLIKEVQEEAGILVEPYRIAGILDKKFYNHPPSPYRTYMIFALCRIISGEVKAGAETLDAAFFGRNELPELSPKRITPEQMNMIFGFLDDPDKEIVFN